MNEIQLQKIEELCSYIDSLYYKEGILNSEEAEDLTQIILWIKKEDLNEINIQYVIKQLRNCKENIDEKLISSIINKFRKACG
jgi:chemotaxis regulatin CheY-phosphate phosphatase CheZ